MANCQILVAKQRHDDVIKKTSVLIILIILTTLSGLACSLPPYPGKACREPQVALTARGDGEIVPRRTYTGAGGIGFA